MSKKDKNLNIEMDTNLRIRMNRYIFNTWPENTHGKIRQVIEAALTEYLDKVAPENPK